MQQHIKQPPPGNALLSSSSRGLLLSRLPTVIGRSTRVRSVCQCQPPGQQQQGAPVAQQQPPASAEEGKAPAAAARSILSRRSVVDDDALHRPLGLVLFGAYVLGSAASLVGAWCSLYAVCSGVNGVVGHSWWTYTLTQHTGWRPHRPCAVRKKVSQQCTPDAPFAQHQAQP